MWARKDRARILSCSLSSACVVAPFADEDVSRRGMMRGGCIRGLSLTSVWQLCAVFVFVFFVTRKYIKVGFIYIYFIKNVELIIKLESARFRRNAWTNHQCWLLHLSFSQCIKSCDNTLENRSFKAKSFYFEWTSVAFLSTDQWFSPCKTFWSYYEKIVWQYVIYVC